ncbi:coiled-coil domain-containing protein 166 [Pelodytes ibericus]
MTNERQERGSLREPTQGLPRTAIPVQFCPKKEEFLQTESGGLSEDVRDLAEAIGKLKLENIFLGEEAEKIQRESEQYIDYLSRHKQRQRIGIITLSDFNQHQLQEVQKEKQKVVRQMEKDEAELRRELMDRERKLSTLTKELADLQPYRDLQAEQKAKIRALEREVLKLRVLRTEKVHALKNMFLQDKASLHRESTQRVTQLSKRVMKEAAVYLQTHVRQVRAENGSMRAELARLVRRATLLDECRLRLQRQNQKLQQKVGYRRGRAFTRRIAPHKRQRRIQGAVMSEGRGPDGAQAKHLLGTEHKDRQTNGKKTSARNQHRPTD